ncbi:hypothetical protein [Halobacillus litoralis]|uniref:hypothetical protein n=1 Tax=Halobacillus litoralis TaxID=45668 RepID=UPI001CFEA57A|nr:hypothetical protein [Halobacillus litoralis]
MGHVLLTGVLIVLACLLTIKGVRERSIWMNILQFGFLGIGVFLIAISIVGIVILGEQSGSY